MKTRCTLRLRDAADDQVWSLTRALIDHANEVAGVPLVSDQALLEAQTGRRRLFEVLADAQEQESSPVGIALLADHEFDLVIDPDQRLRGFGGCAVEHILSLTTGDLRVWVHGKQPAAEAVLSSRAFHPVRELLEMQLRPVPKIAAPGDVPDGMRITAFTPADGAAWVALNARVFAEHPEQGSLTLADLEQRMREPWFNPEHFLLLWDSAELIGYCWLKVQAVSAELYVIGVAPERSGQSLGARLLEHALHRVQHCDEMTLFVDGTNAHALTLYESRGFVVTHTSRQWLLTRRLP